MTQWLHDKRLLLGVCGGIAAYKSVEVLRLLVKGGAHVRVIMTENARWFVGPGTFQALSGVPVCTSVFNADDAAIRHIDWAREADLAVVAPATANCLGKLAGGIADDALSTFMLAVTAPVLLCPSMNTHMYQHPAVQSNLARLRGFGHTILEPDAGQLACGTLGPGRLPAPEVILEAVLGLLAPQDLAGRRLLVTAGPTREPIDPVRFISNPSSGKMGFAIARAARHRGAAVTLVSGPVDLPDPPGITVRRVTTAAEMTDAVLSAFADADIVVKTAAVSDYRPRERAPHKIKKTSDTLGLTLEKTTDILKTLGERKRGQILVGFAAETQELAAHAAAKLEAKNLDMIVGNLVGSGDAGFGCDTNRVTLFLRDGSHEALPLMDKYDLAHAILDRLGRLAEQT
jgi:phosphopantothenoylcysteine decarboxylase/phosphopantothenate--cysteine ligase